MKQKDMNFIESFSLNKELESAVCDFVDMRIMIKKPMTERAIKMLINKVQKMANDLETQVAIIDQSIMNNWTDIYPIRNNYMNKKESDWETIY